MATDSRRTGRPSIAHCWIGISGLSAAWALHQHPDRIDFRLFEAQAQIGGNAITSDMPQDDGNNIPFDISVTACIPLGGSPHPAADGKVQHRIERHQIQIQREVQRPCLPLQFRFRHKRTIATGNCEVSKGPEAVALVRLVNPFSLDVAECPQPVLLHQYGNCFEFDRSF